MKVTIYDGIWQGCTWYVDVNKLTLNEGKNKIKIEGKTKNDD